MITVIGASDFAAPARVPGDRGSALQYRLKYDPAAEAVHEAMPPGPSEALTLALAAACNNPIGATQPYGEDDGVIRMLITDHAFAVLLIGDVLKTVTVLQINYLG
ncbi:hypothetical protein ACIGO8_08200 [Streptomyces sp. NPDC053493]|uniref:hypothetical protein n=1 Tax=Streptomyces sp. NPDC053493 TaxID=3365705 RepID=UPI0037D92856